MASCEGGPSVNESRSIGHGVLVAGPKDPAFDGTKADGAEGAALAAESVADGYMRRMSQRSGAAGKVAVSPAASATPWVSASGSAQ